MASSTPLEPRWRYFIETDRLPWLQDHVVDDLVVFPGAAYLSMVIEATRQLYRSIARSTTSEIRFRDVRFEKALVVPPTPAKIEVQLSFTDPSHSIEMDGFVCRDFRISAVTIDGVWNQHCRGSLSVHDMSWHNHSNTAVPTAPELGQHLEILDNPPSQDLNELDGEEIYRMLGANGNSYGPSFAAIKSIRVDKNGRAVGTVTITEVAKIMPAQHLSPHLIHPTSLDALIHFALPPFLRITGPGSIMPTAIEDLRTSSAMKCIPGTSFDVTTRLRKTGVASARADVVTSDRHDSAQPVLRASGIHLRWFPRKVDSATGSRPLCDVAMKVEWRKDVDALSPSLFDTAMADIPSERVNLLNQATLVFIERSLVSLENRSHDMSKPHYAHLVTWMHHQRRKNGCAQGSCETGEDKVLQQLQCHGIEGQMFAKVGQNLTSVLTGRSEPLDLMLEDDFLYKFYANQSNLCCSARLGQHVTHLCFKKPYLRVLEVGAGTGSTTIPILKALRSEQLPLGEYVFTDISSGFFDEARKLLSASDSVVTFSKLDVSRDPEIQGYQAHSFDLIVAANVIHATESIGKSLANIRKLLKPDGKLALIEVTQPHVYLGLIFGTLPGWWLGKLSLSRLLRIAAGRASSVDN